MYELLLVNINDSSLFNVLLVASASDFTNFWHTFFTCPVIPQNRHFSLTAGQSFWFIDTLGVKSFQIRCRVWYIAELTGSQFPEAVVSGPTFAHWMMQEGA